MIVLEGRWYVYDPIDMVPQNMEKHIGKLVCVQTRTSRDTCFVRSEGFDAEIWETNVSNLRNPKSEEVEEPDTTHPDHYRAGMEPIDYVRSYMSKDQFFAICEFNVVKYLNRHGKKNGLDDLKKAARYIQYMIDYEEDKNAKA